MRFFIRKIPVTRRVVIFVILAPLILLPSILGAHSPKSIFPPPPDKRYPSAIIFYSSYWIYLTTKSHILFNSDTLYEISDVTYKNIPGETVFVEVISIYCPNVRPKQISPSDKKLSVPQQEYQCYARDILYNISRVRHRYCRD